MNEISFSGGFMIYIYIYLPLLGTAVSNNPTATANAEPVALEGLKPSPTCHGSRAKSSYTDSNEKPHSDTGTKNRPIA